MARVAPDPGNIAKETFDDWDSDEEEKKDKEIAIKKKVVLTDDEFRERFEAQKKKYMGEEIVNKEYHGHVRIEEPDSVDTEKVIYTKKDFLNMYENKYQISDDDIDSSDESDGSAASYRVKSKGNQKNKKASTKTPIPVASASHMEKAANPVGTTEEEKEIFALASQLRDTDKLTQGLYVKDEKRLKKQKRKKEIKELTKDDKWYTKCWRFWCCKPQPGHKRRIKEEQMFIFHVKNENLEAVKTDMENFSDPNFRDIDGKTVLIIACFMGTTGIVRNLIGNGADVNMKDFEHGMAPLHYVCKRGWSDLIQWLMQAGADVNIRDNQGRTPMMIASTHGKMRCMTTLMNYNPRLDYIDNKKWGAVHYAAWAGQMRAVQWLFKEGAWITKKDAAGKYPLDYAREFRHKLIAMMLAEMEKGTYNPRKYDYPEDIKI